MALSSQLYLVLFLLLPVLAISTSNPHHDHLKSMHFTAYMHDTINKTDFVTYPGIGGIGFTATTAPFGSIFIVKDPLTVSPDPTSKVIGTTEVISITSTVDGLYSMTNSKTTLDVQGHKGSLNTVGVQSNYKVTDTPVLGGSGDFAFVQGYIQTSLVSFRPEDFYAVYKLDFHLIWPPYAALAAKTLHMHG